MQGRTTTQSSGKMSLWSTAPGLPLLLKEAIQIFCIAQVSTGMKALKCQNAGCLHWRLQWAETAETLYNFCWCNFLWQHMMNGTDIWVTSIVANLPSPWKRPVHLIKMSTSYVTIKSWYVESQPLPHAWTSWEASTSLVSLCFFHDMYVGRKLMESVATFSTVITKILVIS